MSLTGPSLPRNYPTLLLLSLLLLLLFSPSNSAPYMFHSNLSFECYSCCYNRQRPLCVPSQLYAEVVLILI